MPTTQSRAAKSARRADQARLPCQQALFADLAEPATAGQGSAAHGNLTEGMTAATTPSVVEVAAAGHNPDDGPYADTGTTPRRPTGAATRRSVPLAAIVADPPTHDSDDDVRHLAESIAEHGLLQAPLVRPHPTQQHCYLIVFGRRRIAAHRLLGRATIEVRVQTLSDAQAFILSCVENIHRRERSPAEEMDLVGVLIDTLGTQEAVAGALRVSPTWVSKRCRVADHPPVAAAVATQAISLDHAYDIITRSAGAADMQAHLNRALNDGQSQDATRQRTGGARRGRTRPAPAADGAAVSDRNPTDKTTPAGAESAPSWPAAVDTGSAHPGLDASDGGSPVLDAGVAEARVNRAMLQTVRLFDVTGTAPARDVWPLLIADIALVRDLLGSDTRVRPSPDASPALFITDEQDGV